MGRKRIQLQVSEQKRNFYLSCVFSMSPLAHYLGCHVSHQVLGWMRCVDSLSVLSRISTHNHWCRLFTTNDGVASKNWQCFNIVQLNYWPCVNFCVGWPKPIWSSCMLQCNAASTLQLSNCGSLTSANHQQHTTHNPNACSLPKGCGFESNCSQNPFLFECLIWE